MTHTTRMKEKLPLLPLLSLSVAAFSTNLTELLPAGVMSQMGADLGESPARIGLMVSAYAIATSIAALPIITLTRSVPRKSLLQMVLFGFAIVNVVTAISSNFTLTIIARIFGGVLAGVMWPLMAGYAARLVTKENIGRAVAIALGGSTLSLALGLPLGSLLGSLLGWRASFGLLSLIALLLTVWIAWKMPSFPGERADERIPLAKVFVISGIPLIVMANFTTMLAHYMLYTYIEPLIETLHIYGGTSVALLIFGIGAVAGVLLTGKFVDRYLRLSALTSIVLTILVMLIISLFGTIPGVIHIALFLWGTAFGCSPVFQTAINKVADKARDVASSILTTMYNAGIFGGALLGGIILDEANILTLPWIVAILMGVSFVLIYSGHRTAFPRIRRDKQGL
ncbi:Purine efflux pump PbuE [Paenibacillus plantiphilus]|uniref:Purine efflux pump PbuE n=1 Tax=Paenibacillus plantiphilus TaxID=2905650 RepID=A0ABN8G991_9BACL|nr:MFS transporter [Paenibacillus plantiphilus]CAH1203535.1 Purine efflux pump PbuE [Paenibacillus plantiphilus]